MKIGLVGYFAINVEKGKVLTGGQMTKAKNIYEIVCRNFSAENVLRVDTYNWNTRKLSIIRQIVYMSRNCEIIIMMPSQNGVKVFLPILSILKNVYKYKLIYPVVGGWLADLLAKKRILQKFFGKVDYVLPETRHLASKLKTYTKNKIEVMPVFSLRQPLDHLSREWKKSYVFGTFSRITPEKGIDDAINAILRVNEKHGDVICKLEICGPMDIEYSDYYETIFREHEDVICYRGLLPDQEVIQTLSQFYMLLFPTYYEGEGFPASLCESYMAGTPVIASDWKYNSELIDDGVTGFLFKVHDIEQMIDLIDRAISNPDKIYEMRENAFRKGKQYTPEIVTNNMIEWIKCESISD